MVPQDKKIEQLFIQQSRFKSKSSSCKKNTVYIGNSNDQYVVVSLWIFYMIGSAYFLALVSPYLWVEYSPAITIVGIFVSIPGLYNAIKCYFTVTFYQLLKQLDPGVLKKGTFIKEVQKDEEKQIVIENDEHFIHLFFLEQQLDSVQVNQQNQKIEHNLETQKIVINEKSQNLLQPEKQKQNIEQNLVDESHNKNQKSSPKLEVELTQPQQQEGQHNVDLWVESMKKGLNQIQNGLNNFEQPVKMAQDGQEYKEGTYAPTVNSHDTSSQPVFINPFPIKLPQHKNGGFKGGNLFEERYCDTCQLKRPPLASHCSECNQCVKNFDHHCFFMGNCIGQRNHKNFYLFLWCTQIWVLYGLVFSIISFVDNIKKNGFVFEQFYNNTPLFYVFISFIALFILTFALRCNEQTVRTALIPALIVTLVSFIWIASYQDIDYYANPVFPLICILIDVFATFALLNFAIFDCFLACIGSTIKQESYKSKNKVEREKFTFSKGCSTYIKFLTFKPPKSEILNE